MVFIFEKIKLITLITISVLLLLFVIPFDNIKSYISYALYSKESLIITLSTITPNINTISSDSSNRISLKVSVNDANGNPIPKAHIVISEKNNLGTIYPNDTRTDSLGECLISYTPPEYTAEQLMQNKKIIQLSASIYQSKVQSSLNLNLTSIPIVFVHGYQAKPEMFADLSNYLSSAGYSCFSISYNSSEGVKASSAALSSFLKEKQLEYLSKGIQIKRFNIIAHSMGGLVARYYTASKEYIPYSNVSRLIFISVPHNGSHLASIGQNYFNDQAIIDLTPDSPLLSNVFPSLTNNGLNHRIQVGNIIDQYDEVVSLKDASLEDWGIKTEIFNIGDNNYSVNNILNGNILDNQNHAIILNNRKVFEKVKQMLEGHLPFPAIKK